MKCEPWKWPVLVASDRPAGRHTVSYRTLSQVSSWGWSSHVWARLTVCSPIPLGPEVPGTPHPHHPNVVAAIILAGSTRKPSLGPHHFLRHHPVRALFLPVAGVVCTQNLLPPQPVCSFRTLPVLWVLSLQCDQPPACAWMHKILL